MFAIRWGDAGTAVRDHDTGTVCASFERYISRLTIFDGIGDQIDKGALKATGMTFGEQAGADLKMDPVFGKLARGAYVFQHPGKIHGFMSDPRCAIFGKSQGIIQQFLYVREGALGSFAAPMLRS